MSPLIHCSSISKAFGSKDIFQNLSFSIFSGDRIGLIGPNGSGKSTLMKILAGVERSDLGEVVKGRELKVGYVPQVDAFDDLLPSEVLLKALEGRTDLQDYEKDVLVQTKLSKLEFQDDGVLASKLSGGWKKRLSIARELILSPDLLLLDEPTNHLDLEGVQFLERFLVREGGTYLLVSHDRFFLERTVNKVIEVSPSFPGGIFSVDSSYRVFLEKKEQFLLGQIEKERSLKSKAKKEADWLKRSPKARTTKSRSRIDEAEKLFDELSLVSQRNRRDIAGVEFASSGRETKRLLSGKNLSKSMGEKLLFEKLDLNLSPGTRLALMGKNGSGKTTLLKLLAGELKSDSGTIKRVDSLQTVYFDQHRTKLPDDLSLKQALCPHGDFVNYHGRQIHVNGWCKRFLFSPEILDMAIGKLSGGERARISIARLMLEPADILLLDEPTNDLDIATLEVLEESLLEFSGALVLISHDRFMLDRVCNQFLSLSQNEMYASYSKWEEAQENVGEPVKSERKTVKRSKLSNNEKKEIREIEKEIAKLEAEVEKLNESLSDPKVSENSEKLQEVCTLISAKETKMENLYLRFFELDQG